MASLIELRTNHNPQSNYTGLTGQIEFNSIGIRSDVEIDILTLDTNGPTRASTFKPSRRNMLEVVKSDEEEVIDTSDLPINKMTFKVITSLVAPFAMLKDTSIELFGNDRYEGFGIDIIDKLSELYGFKYEFMLQEDKHVGSVINADKNQWDGMIGKIMSGVSIFNSALIIYDLPTISSGTLFFNNVIFPYLLQEADLAITDLTINSERITALDFTPSFMNLGFFNVPSCIGIPAKSPTKIGN